MIVLHGIYKIRGSQRVGKYGTVISSQQLLDPELPLSAFCGTVTFSSERTVAQNGENGTGENAM